MSTTLPNVVIVAYDFSTHGRVVLDRAVALVSRAPFHVLHFITVIDPHNGVSGLPRDGAIDYRYADRVRDLMTEEVAKTFGGTVIPAEIHCFMHARIGKPADEILDLGKEIGADLVMVGTHGFTGLERILMGSTAERVVREAGCPVLVVRAKTNPDVKLMSVVEVAHHEPSHRRPLRFSYENTNLIMRPPTWPIH